MATQMFVNLPVKDLDRTMSFFTALGFSFNPQFTNETAACMIINDDCFVMLLREEFFKSFTVKPIADATKTTEVLISLSRESKQDVIDTVDKALKAGGTSPNPAQDHGWMYQHGFQDLDGHVWEVAFMDQVAAAEFFANQENN